MLKKSSFSRIHHSEDKVLRVPMKAAGGEILKYEREKYRGNEVMFSYFRSMKKEGSLLQKYSDKREKL